MCSTLDNERVEKIDVNFIENMLYQMLLHTEEDFRAAQLQVSPKAPEYFNTNCKHSLSCDIPIDAFINFLRPAQEESNYLQLVYQGTS